MPPYMSSRWLLLFAPKKLRPVSALLLISIFVSACASSDTDVDFDARHAERIRSVPEEIMSLKAQLESRQSDVLQIRSKELNVILPDGSRMEFVWIPPTTSKEWKKISGGRDYYLMGDNREDYSPVRFVRLDYGLFVAKTEVTQRQWTLLMNHNPSKNSDGDSDNYPVDSVSLRDVTRFIQKFSAAHSLRFFDRVEQLIRYRDYVYRLPTEAEWEYGSRAGMLRPTEGYLEETTWYRHASRGSQSVATKLPNHWGLYDMLGNVFEMTADCWPTNYDIKFGDPTIIRVNPLGSADRVNARGGAWYSSNHVDSFAWRSSCNLQAYKGNHVGLRLVLAPPLSALNRAPDPGPKPASVLISDQLRQLKKTSEQGCDEKLRINEAYVAKEFNDHIFLKVCYEYSGTQTSYLSALTYANGKNTGKWGYQPGSVDPGVGCTAIRLSKSSLFAYTSDAISIEPYASACKVMFAFEKHWTDGTDERRASEERSLSRHLVLSASSPGSRVRAPTTKTPPTFAAQPSAPRATRADARKVELSVKSGPGEVLTCRGRVPAAAGLDRVGLSAHEIEQGVKCLRGDFDGKGAAEWLLYGAPGDEGRNFIALFVDDQGHLLKPVRIFQPGVHYVWLYHAGTTYGQFGEPALDVDGLVQWGEGGTTYILVYDEEKKSFTTFGYASEWH